MAGGIGSRFWPMSRQDYPKQFLDILNTGRTLIQWTFDRFASFIPTQNIYVVTSNEYADIVRELIDGDTGLRQGHTNMASNDPAWWENYRSRLEQAARDADRDTAPRI